MRPFIRACWLASSAESGTDADVASLQRYLDAIAEVTNGARAAYRLVGGGATMESIKSRLDAIDVGTEAAATPNCLVLTETDTLDEALDVDRHAQSAAAAIARDAGAQALQTVVRGVYREITFTPGVEQPPTDGFGPAIQLGTFNMRSPDDEWAISEWYRTRRLPSFAAAPGGIRVRRLVSVCAGPAKLGVLYEFVSLEARLANFEPLEAEDHDEQRPTAAARTVHPPFSPAVAALLPLRV